MGTDALICHDLLAQCEQVATFTRALRRVAWEYPWSEVEPYAEEAWSQISEDHGLHWSMISAFVSEQWTR